MRGIGITPGRMLLWVGGLSGVGLLLALWFRPPSSASGVWREGDRRPRMLERGAEAPRFVLPTVTGETVDRVSVQGERLALVFVRPRCPHCERLEGYLKGMALKEGERLWLVSTGNREEVGQMLSTHAFSFPVLVDSNGTVSRAYGILGVPTVYLIDGSGRIEVGTMGMPVAWKMIQQFMLRP